MKDVYKNLFKLENDIIAFLKRYKNIYGENVPRTELIKHINSINIPNEVINDAIDLVCALNNITTMEYINKMNYFRATSTIKKIKTIKNKEELINLYKKEMTPFGILSEPVGLFEPSTSNDAWHFYINTAKKLWRILPINYFI